MPTSLTNWAIGFDLGGTNIRAALVSQQGEVRAWLSRPTNSPRGSDAVIQDIIALIKETLAQAPSPVIGVGIAAPGPLDPKDGVIINSPNLKWHNVPLKRMLEDALGLDVTVDNDSQMTAFGERWMGAGRGADHLALLTLGTGVGGGVIFNGRIYHGESGSAGHIGHYILNPDGPPCACGARGCLEALASGPNIVRRAREAIESGRTTSLVETVDGDLDNLTSLMIFQAAQQGDALAIETFRDTGRYIGQALASLLPILDPKLVIISGQVALAGDLILEPARQRLAELIRIRPPVAIVQGELGDDGGIIGAAGVIFANAGLIA